jgi:uncharacterized protein (TIGR02145 family)
VKTNYRTLRAVFLAPALCLVSVCLSGCGDSGEPGVLIDKRDGKTYRIAKMPDGKIWMAENLNYQPRTGENWCYSYSDSCCEKYGLLYDWETAKTVCPPGWYLPSREDWEFLVFSARGKMKSDDLADNHWRDAGKKLKADNGWNDFTDDRDYAVMTRGNRRPYESYHFEVKEGNGTDDYGFSALPGGYCPSFRDNDFYGAGTFGRWWTATEYDSYSAYIRGMSYSHNSVPSGYDKKSSGSSVRCVKDN